MELWSIEWYNSVFTDTPKVILVCIPIEFCQCHFFLLSFSSVLLSSILVWKERERLDLSEPGDVFALYLHVRLQYIFLF